MFLRKKDFDYLIRTEKLDVIINNDVNLLYESMRVAQSEIESYIRHRYDVAKIFINIKDFAEATAFIVDDLVEWVEVAYINTASYVIDDRVSYQGLIYKCIVNSTGNLPTDTNFWELSGENQGLYTCIANSTGNLPNNNNYFIKGDNRNSQIKTYNIDIALYHAHSQINPRNIPEFRVARRDDAVAWLKLIAKGSITADLPIYTDTSKGQSVVWGSNDKNERSDY